MTASVSISTPSRLHFGLLRLHETADRSFGGLGMMIDSPRVELRLSAADEWRVTGPGAKRAAEFAAQALDAVELPNKPAALAVEVASIVPQHRGLGGGTQLALAVAAGVRELLGLPPATASQLAATVGRGHRSAVGSHGFLRGGLIWERGRTSGDSLAELSARVALPSDWRIVLITPLGQHGLSGDAERSAFSSLPPVSAARTCELESIAEDEVLPAARAADCNAFGDAVYRYGRLAGECFAAVQGGPYASPEITDCVAAIRNAGIHGVGQSSWGPTVFAVTANDHVAVELTKKLRSDVRWANYDISIAAPDNVGAIVSTQSADTRREVRRHEQLR